MAKFFCETKIKSKCARNLEPYEFKNSLGTTTMQEPAVLIFASQFFKEYQYKKRLP